MELHFHFYLFVMCRHIIVLYKKVVERWQQLKVFAANKYELVILSLLATVSNYFRDVI